MQDTLALARNGLRTFAEWWSSELAALVPGRLRRSRRRDRQGVVLVLQDGALALIEAAGDGERELARAPAAAPEADVLLRAGLKGVRQRRRGATLRLGPELGLRKVLDLPLAASNDLDQLLAFEMDRLTPFKADEVSFAHRVLRTDTEERRITVEIQAAPRAVIDHGLAAAERLGLQPRRVELAADEADDSAPLNLLSRAAGEVPRASRLNRMLALMALVLAAAAVVIPLQQQRSTAADLEQRVAAARTEAEQSLALREQLDELAARAQFVVGRKTNTPMATRVLAEITRLVPDQAYVVQLYIREGEAHMHGFAEAASDLIGILEQSPLFQAPQFRSPVTRDQRADRERFHISFALGTEED